MAASKAATTAAFTGMWVLVLIGIAAAIRRGVVLVWPGTLSGRNSPAASLDIGFATHRSLTLVHILPGAVFLILATLQFMPRIRQKHIRFHRWNGRSLVALGIVIGITALVMSFTMNIGGVNETAATTFYAIVFLFSLTRAFVYIRRGNVVRHREWMIRAYAVTLGVAATRPVVGAFFATRRMSPHEFFGIAFWIGFTSTVLLAEWWIDYTRNAPSNEEQALATQVSKG